MLSIKAILFGSFILSLVVQLSATRYQVVFIYQYFDRMQNKN